MNTKKRLKIKSKTPIVIAGILVLTAVIGVFIFNNANKPKITLKTQTVEAGEKTKLKSLINIPDEMQGEYKLSVKRGKFDQSKPGVYKVQYIFKHKKSKAKIKESFDIEVADTKAPEIICDEIIYTKLNKPVKIKNHIMIIDSFEGKLSADNAEIVEPQIDYSKYGKYTLQIKAKDSTGNTKAKKVIIAIGRGGNARKLSQKISGYWKGKSTDGSDNYQILQFKYKNGNCYYGGLTWGGNLQFDYISYDNTLATGIVKIETSEKKWTERFFIDIGEEKDGKIHVTFKRGQTTILDDDLTYLGESLEEAKRKLGN